MLKEFEKLKYNKVFEIFENISKIPRDSGNEKQISEYIVNFANERKLNVFQDKLYNVIIKKDASVRI